MSPTVRESIYRSVERSVLWDEPREESFGLMKTNGITGDEAEAMYQRARQERVAMIRGEAFRHAALGTLLFGAGAAVFAYFWYGVGAIPRILAVLCGLAIVFGAWWLLNGVFGFVLAPKKRGPVSSDND